MGWKPKGLCWLLRVLGLRGEDADGDGLGQVAPAVDLLRSLGKDALAGGAQAGFLEVEAGVVGLG